MTQGDFATVRARSEHAYRFLVDSGQAYYAEHVSRLVVPAVLCWSLNKDPLWCCVSGTLVCTLPSYFCLTKPRDCRRRRSVMYCEIAALRLSYKQIRSTCMLMYAWNFVNFVSQARGSVCGDTSPDAIYGARRQLVRPQLIGISSLDPEPSTTARPRRL